MSKHTSEQKKEAFDEAIEKVKDMLSEGTRRGVVDLSPFALLLVERTPEMGDLLKLEPIGSNPEAAGSIHGLIVNPGMITPAGLPVMPPGMFWTVLRGLSHKIGAFATVIGMEAWTAEGVQGRDEIPKDLSKYKDRKESLVVTAEREGEKRMFTARIKRENNVISFDPWAEATPGGTLSGRVFNTVPGNTLS